MTPPQETGEFEAIIGGDSETGVELPKATDGLTAVSASIEVEPVPEGEQFPSKTSLWGD